MGSHLVAVVPPASALFVATVVGSLAALFAVGLLMTRLDRDLRVHGLRVEVAALRRRHRERLNEERRREQERNGRTG